MRTSKLAWTSPPAVDRAGALRDLAVLEAAVAALEEGVTVHDPSGRVVVANPAALRLLGAASAEPGGPDSPPYCDEVMDVVRSGRGLRQCLVEHIRPDDGRRRWLRANVEPLRCDEGVTHVVCSFVDITDEQALRTFRLLARQLRAVFADERTAVFVKDLEGRYVFSSPAHAADVGRPHADLRDVAEDEVIDGEQLEAGRRLDAEALARREPVQGEAKVGDRTLSLVRFPLLDDQDEPFALAGVTVDVTGVRRDEQELGQRLEPLRLQLDAVDQGILLVDEELRVTSINATGRRLLQRGGGALALSPVEVVDVREAEDDEIDLTGPLPRLVRASIATGTARRDALARLETPDGELRWLSVDVLPPADADGVAVVTMRDVTGDQQRQEELLEAAYRDQLTGLGNRRLFDETLSLALERARRYGQPLAVCLLDVDDLKGINDRHGHAAGDRALRVVGQVLREELRGADLTVRATPGVLPSRYGGDEFLVLFTDLGEGGGPEAAARIAVDRVLAALGRAAADVAVSVSTGISSFPADGEDPASLLTAADRRMYQHKRRHAAEHDHRRAGA